MQIPGHRYTSKEFLEGLQGVTSCGSTELVQVALCTDITIFLLRVERRTNNVLLNKYSSRALPKVIINTSCAMTIKKE